ncbi:ATP-binding cassette domain-containing protein [Frigoribacterium faeni]|uniref:ATP-binding cassette domain-containing protein n=1 Tax=Frigoribacterium faeni TaxID=145483 RepID=UPI00141BE16C|nr:ABC-2 type transport system ATP-binding protein [Frigoribacterium faeni]
MLELDQVRRSFGDRTALDGVSFGVAEGRLTGFVGANGAGKTTTMRIVLGVLAADSGEVRWDGRPLGDDVRRRFGYMPEERGLYPKMTVLAQLVYLARLHGVGRATARRRALEVLDRLGLGDRARDRLDSLSLGNQQRVQIAAALVHEPLVLVLDEPFSGLDPLAVDVVVAVLREQAAAGVPVLFSSHQLDVVERLCDDLVVIAEGTVRAAGTREELRARFARARWSVVVDDDAGWLRDEPGVTVVELDGPEALVELAPGVDDQAVLAAGLRRGPVRAFHPVLPRLAEIFDEVVR